MVQFAPGMGPHAKVMSASGKRSRTSTIEVGGRYRVEPLNPQKLKHRGRLCLVLDIDSTSGDALVKFEDNGRRARVDMGDLAPA